MTVSKTFVLGLLTFLAASAMGSSRPGVHEEAGDLLLSWTVTGLNISPVSLQGREWLQVSGRPDLNPVSITGAPSVPAIHEWLRLDDLGGFTARIVAESWSETAGTVMPEQEREFGPSGMPFEWAQDAGVYGTPGWYPARTLELGSPVLLRNNRLARLTVFPVQTDPVLNRTRVLQELTVQVTFTDLDERNQRLQHLPTDTSPVSRMLAGRVIEAPGSGSLEDIDDILTLPGTYRVYARTAAVATNGMLTSLLNWKREKGHVVNVITSTNLGGWTAALIKADITNAYNNSATPPDYVLLVGDPSAASGSDYWLPCGDSNSDGTQDHFYSMIEGSDNLGDVAVGRFSVNNSTQLQTVANKVLVYETAPQTADAPMAWLDRAALAVGYDALSMRQLSAAIIDDMVENGLNPAGIATRYGDTSDSQGSWVSGQFGSGIGLYNYRGWIGMNGVGSSFIDNAANFTNSYRTPVAAVFTCSTGDFNNTGYSTTEAFLVKGSVAAPQGAVCAMGLATSLTHTAYNNVLVGGFWSAVLDRDLDQVGPAMFYGKAQLVMNMPENDASADAFSRRSNLMGDPGMDIWVGTPAVLTAALAGGGTTVPLGTSVLDIVVNRNGSPAQGIAVCLYQANTVASRGITDASGHVLLNASGATAGTLKLTASRSRNLPSRVNLTVAAQNGFAGVTQLGISGDGLAAPGEAISLLPTIQNTGGTSIPAPTATLAVNAAYGTVTDNSSSWSTVAAGASTTTSNPFALTLFSGLENGTLVPLVFSFTAGLTTWTETEFLTVSAPRLMATATSFSPGGTQLSPGTTATLNLTLGNLGALAASNLTLVLGNDGDTFVSVVNGTANGFTAAPGGSAVAGFTLSAAANSLRGHVATLPLAWSGGGLSGSTTVDVTVGVPGSASPTGPDAYGYQAIEDTDFHSLAPDYQWIEIATPAGGTGTFIDLGDNGNEEDNSALVTLPFPFSYYGVSYSQMVICSNGFVSFDAGAEVLHDFRNHYFPSGMGPDAMIGVNWDDHKSSGTNGVYVKHLPADHAYVVEWYGMTHNPTGGSNTFQLVLYDPAFHTTPTGDGPFRMQYAVWNNTQSGSSDFDYCSVGIKDHTSGVGLTLSNFDLEPATVEGFEAGRAVYFTTDPGFFDDSDTQAPVVVVGSPAVVEPGDSPTMSASITDQSGVLSATLYYSTNGSTFAPVVMSYGGSHWSGQIPAYALGTTVWYYVYAIDSSENGNSTTSPTYNYTVVDGNPPTGPDAYGYRIFDRHDAGESHDFAWIDISGLGTQLNLGDDATSVVTTPFDIVYYGNTFTQMGVCSNGFVALGNNTYNSWGNGDMGGGDGTGNMISAFWEDLNPNNGGNIRVYDDAANDRFIVSWIGIPHYSGGGPESFQIVFYNQDSYPTTSGNTPFHLQYEVVVAPSVATVGHQNGTMNVGNQYMRDTVYDVNAEPLVSGQSLWVTTGAVVVPPPVPVDDLAIVYNQLALDLSWTGTGAALYNVYQDTMPWGSFTELAGSTAGTTLQLPLSAHKYYRVRSDNGAAARQAPAARRAVQVLQTVETRK